MTVSRSRKVDADAQDGPVKAVEEGSPNIDVVPQGADYKALMSNEQFMNERVTIVLQPTMDPSETGVPVSVNGLRAYIVPGIRTSVRRLHIVQLLKARPDIVTHRTDDEMLPEAQRNIMHRNSTSRYNFDVVEDTQKGAEWFRELREHHFRK